MKSFYMKYSMLPFFVFLISGCALKGEEKPAERVKFEYGYDSSTVNHLDMDGKDKIKMDMELETAIENCRIRGFSTAEFYKSYNNSDCSSRLEKEDICPSFGRIYKCVE